jgi:hypothetical protein
MFFLNKWNQWKNYLEKIMIYFHVTSQILDDSLKQMENFFKDFDLDI